MNEALKRAREIVAQRLEAATADFDAMNALEAERQTRKDERRADWEARIEEDRATLKAIDAAIAAEKSTIRIPVTVNVGELRRRFGSGFTMGEPPFGVVEECAGESIMSSAQAEEAPAAVDRPIQIGDIVQLKGEFMVIGMQEDQSPLIIFDEGVRPEILCVVKRKGPFGRAVGEEIEVRSSDLRRL